MTYDSRLLVTSIVRHDDLNHASDFATVLEPGTGKALMRSPAAVYEVDLEQSKIRNQDLLDGVQRESVYGIACMPDEFTDPPAQLDI